MFRRNALSLAVCAAAMSGAAFTAHAQSAPFTIRRPPDGSSVREKVRIQIPRSSISEGSFVAFYLDGNFYLALPPSDGGDGGPTGRNFEYLWDTKGTGVTDGQHTLKAVLYEPAAGSDSITVTNKASSQVTLTVANKIHNGPSTLRLRYKYREGENLTYTRDSKAVRVGGLALGSESDQEVASITAKLLLGVEDVKSDVTLVRNKLTALSILTQGQEVTYPDSSLSNSMYQEVDALGDVSYETGTLTGLEEFMALDLPVDNTLELPVMPKAPVSVGQSWTTPHQRIDLPGIVPALQPKVTLTSTLVGLEWEGGYPTAKIHQVYNSAGDVVGDSKLVKEAVFASTAISSPTLKYERDIYIAYNAGLLVRTVRTLSLTGRTPSVQSGQMAGGMAGMPGGMSGMPGMQGMPGRGGMPGMQGMPGAMGGGKARPGAMGMGGMGGPSMSGGPGGMPGYGGPGQGGGPPRGAGGPGGMPGYGRQGNPGMQGGPGGMPGYGGMGGPGGMPGYGGSGMGGSGMMGSGRGSRSGRRGAGGIAGLVNGRSGSLTGEATDSPITVKSTTDTRIVKVTQQ